MAPAEEVVRKATRTSTPDPRKQKADSVKENDAMNSPDRVRKTLAGKEMRISSTATPQACSGWRQFARRRTFALVVTVAWASTAVGIAMTSRFQPEMAKALLAKTLLFFADVGVHFKHAADVLGSVDAAEFVQRVLDTTGYFDEAGFFHPSLARNTILALGVVQIAVLAVMLVGPICLQKCRGKPLAGNPHLSDEKAI